MVSELHGITKGEWEAYEKVRRAGRWNMLTPQARRATGLDREHYRAVLRHYHEMADQWKANPPGPQRR